MKGHIFSSTWMECCTTRSQITNHKITFSGRRNVTEPCKLWKTELLLKSGLCSSATSVQMLGLCRHWWDTAASSQKYISLCFSFNCSQPKGSSHSKGHFLGSVNHQPGLIQYFCLTSKSLSPSWPGVLGCFSKRCWIPQGKFLPGIIKVNGSPHPSSFTENCSYFTFSTELHERALHRGGTAHCKKCMQLFSIIWNTWRIQH